MAKKSSIVKQQRRERMVALKKERRQELKKIIYDQEVSGEEREKAVAALDALPRNSSAVRLRRRCQMTGRSRGNLRKFCISRICFRDLASNGMIPGVMKSSW